MHAEGLLPASLCSVSLLSSEQCLQFERFHLQHAQVVNQTFSFKRELIGNKAEAIRVNHSIV